MSEIDTGRDSFPDLSPLQNKAIRVLLTRGSITQAVKITGIARVTFYRWLEDENFRAVLNYHSRAILDSVSRQLVMASEDAVALLTSVINDTDKPISLRIKASETVLNNVMRMVALSDLNNRLSVLESLEKEGTDDYAVNQSAHQNTRAA